MDKRVFVVLTTLIFTMAISIGVWAGGPVCPPRGCPPQPCAPVMCAPQPCMPPSCAPAPCGPICPPPPCGPQTCTSQCEENPLAQIFKGACRLVVGVVALPFKIVDGIFGGFDCPPSRRYASCAPARMCAPPPPPCMPAMCPPVYCPPMGCGIGAPRPAPVGFGFGGPRVKKFSPFGKKESAATSLIAAPTDGFFGTYW